jgi:tRNA G18 (ribose-2'-O)-methylase SpoU
MKESANNIGKRKWLRLSVRQQHTAIARFAAENLETKDLKKFLRFYNQVMGRSQLDRFDPPIWLTEAESLRNYLSFHQKLSGKPPHYFSKKSSAFVPLSWNAGFPVTVALDQVLTPYNFGSILRVVDNFGFAGMVHSSEHLNLSHPQLKKAARGAEDWIPVTYEKDLPGFLQSAKAPVIGLELTDASIPICEWIPPDTFNLVIGNEAYGISKEILKCCTQCIYIPMSGYKHSMNLSHALAVAAFYIVSHTKSE